jgi:hypothetical protein
MTDTATQFKATWARLRDSSGDRNRNTPAHLVALQIDDQRLTHCGDKIDGHAWMKQPAGDTTRRCGRCEESERNYLNGKVEPA